MIIIGNKVYKGNNLSISNNKIIIDGKDVTNELPDQKTYNIKVEGSIDSVKCDACDKIEVAGDVGSISTQSGDIKHRK